MIDKPKRKASRLGTFGEVLYSLSPETVDIVLNQAYNLFPDSKAAEGQEGGAAGGREGRRRAEARGDQGARKMSTEAVRDGVPAEGRALLGQR